MKIKTNQLIREALDWAVAKCEGRWGSESLEVQAKITKNYLAGICYSTDCSQGGPIIDREKISCVHEYNHITEYWWAMDKFRMTQYGPTRLIAAMRCYVASKLGDEIEVPDELCMEILEK